MSFMDKLKTMFSGGSSASEHDHDHSHEGHDHSHDGHDHAHDHAHAIDEMPPAPAAPMDPLGTTEPDPIPGQEDRTV